MSTTDSGVRPQAHRVETGPDGTRYEATGVWTIGLPDFVETCAGDDEAHVEHRGGRTFVVVDR
ncbi:MAG: hypothetical protein ABEJ35_01370 [Halobacteriaceae archaeon]